MYFKRLLNLSEFDTTAFLFGPRMTGKTTLLRKIKTENYFDMLDPDLELQYRSQPKLFWEQVSILKKGATIIIDEIQKVPQLLNYIQMGIDRLNHVYILSGSSARKLKRGGANLLGGRALDLKLHPLTAMEIDQLFNLDNALQYGTLPKIYSLITEKKWELVLGHLKSYVTTYIKEEIQAEAITRNVGAFQRFLNVAGQNNAQVIEFSNISRECSVPASTVKEYYQILEDTLIGFFLWPFDRSERKKARPKSYFFDCGVVRAIQNRLQDPPSAREKGFLFETWLLNELKRLRDYLGKPYDFSFWRERNHEVDILISKGQKPLLAIECKSTRQDISASTVRSFQSQFPKTKMIIASMIDKRSRLVNGIEIHPWNNVLEIFKKL
jgi:predicted AAA+ superfamily ATPase